MRLNSIKLAGFKSFAEPTVFQMPGQLVGVVGPNGCGKSNIMDAVRWVLGESRASELRGGTMQDVIFNGSTHRKPASRASVELVFGNDDHRAGGQWNQFSEIAVKRVLTRDGGASYHINGQVVRKRDVQDVFMGTGLGPRAYAIIGQGTISRIIESRPEELRLFLEEAAGVSKYKERRRESENRLHDTRENMTRVSDILRELNGNLDKLEKQAAVASQYQALQAQAKLRQHEFWYAKLTEAQQNLTSIQSEGLLAVNALEARHKEVAATQNELEQVRQAHYASADVVSLAQGQLYEASTEVGRLEAEIRFVGEGRERAQSRLTQLADMANRLRERLQVAEQERSALTDQIQERQAQAEVLEAQNEQLAEQIPTLEQALHQTQQETQKEQSAAMQVQQQLQALATEQRLGQEQLRTLETKQAKLRQEKSSLNAPDEVALLQLDEQVIEAQATLEDLRAQLEELQEQLPAAQAARSSAFERNQAQQNALAQHTARLHALEALQEKVEREGKMHAWLQEQGLAHLNPLWKSLHIEAGWENALESALRERMQAVPVSKLESVLPFANDAQAGKMGKMVFYSEQGAGVLLQSQRLVSHLPASHLPTSLLPLSQRLQLTPEQEGHGFAAVLRIWLSACYCATTLQEALDLRAHLQPGERILTPEGHAITLVSVDFYAQDHAEAGVLARAQEIEALRQALIEQQNEAEAAKQLAKQAEIALIALQTQSQQLQQQHSKQQTECHALQVKLLGLKQARTQYLERNQTLSQSAEATQREANAWQDRLELAAARFETLDLDLAQVQERHARAQEAELLARQKLQVLQTQLQTLARSSQEAAFQLRSLEAKTQELRRSGEDAKLQLTDLAEQDARTQAELMSLSGASAQLGLQAALDVKLEREAALAKARSRYDELTATLRSSDEKRMLLERELEPLRKKITEFQLKEQAARIAAEQYRQYLLDAGFEDDAALAALRALVLQDGYLNAEGQVQRLTPLQQEIERTQREIVALGAVNLAALEELGSARERKTFLDSQCADLSEAMQTLEDAIRRIDAETRDLLGTTFESVNRHFGEMFPKLFGGGQARLVMTGEEILDAGVQVIAQPPGKKNQTIQLLSGGEKALTAIALVFAIFQLNPAPFCLLDEVDAPLDDANTVRYANLVKEMSSRTQFLFISHNKIAMEMAEQLIGVTMQEQGVSRIVAVDMQAAASFLK